MRRWVLLVALLALPARGEPDVRAIGPGGAEITLHPAAGETLLLHFWATWCPSCEQDLDALQRTAADCAHAPIRVVTVNVGEEAAEADAFVASHQLALPVVRDPKGRLWRETDGRGLPMNLYWSGGSRRTDVGPKTADAWQRLFASLGCPSDAGGELAPGAPGRRDSR